MANEVTSFEVQGNEYDVNPHLTFDTTPTVGSSNPVTSNGIALAVQGAAIGTDISVGRTDGTPVGYCSISYGTDNVAAGDYSIVFGKENRVYSPFNIVSGESNEVYGDGSNWGFSNGSGNSVALGMHNTVDGARNVNLGMHNKLGYHRQNIPEYTPKGNADNDIYIGYIDLAQKKVYYDPEHTSEITLPSSNAGERSAVYIVDLTSNESQNVGDIYYRYRVYTTSAWLFKKMDPISVQLVDRAYNHQFVYCGPCYYNISTDKNYSDSAMTVEIPYNSQKGGCIYFDANAQKFVAGTGSMSIINVIPVSIGNDRNQVPHWRYCKPYKGRRSGGNQAVDGMTGSLHTQNQGFNGREAYIKYDFNDRSTMFKVYDSSEYTHEITDQLYDGEMVVDISSGYMVMYLFDADHHISYGEKIYSNTYGNIVAGAHHETGQGQGYIIGGYYNSVPDLSSATAIFGANNTVMTGNGGNNDSGITSMGVSVLGANNTLKCNTAYFKCGSIIGRQNNITVDGNSDLIYVIGDYSNVDGSAVMDIHAYGYYNYVHDADRTHTYGNENTITGLRRGIVIGSQNTVQPDWPIYEMHKNQFGIWTGAGVSFDENTKTYTYDTNCIYKIYEKFHIYDDAREFSRLAYSTDGHTLTAYSNATTPLGAGYETGFILGCHNTYLHRAAPTYNQGPWSDDMGCYMIGAYNRIYGRINYKGVGCIGYGLNIDRAHAEPNDYYYPESDGAIYLGAYNTLDYTRFAQLVLGGGSSDSNRKNLLVIYKGYGFAIMPEAPATIAALVGMSGVIGVPAGKGLITYEMLQDYTGGHSGSPVPNTTIIVLDKDNWSNFEQEIDASGITENSVVMINPSGVPTAYYADSIYLKTQGDGTLTFGCVSAPSVDISVKVVYWT